MHKRLEAIEAELREELTNHIHALEWAQETLDALGLTPLLDSAAHVAARPHHGNPDRYVVCAYFPGEQKAAVMPLLTASGVEEWKRSQALGHDDTVGRWTQRLYTDLDYYDNGHRITVRFVDPIEEGETVGGCTVKRMERVISTLAIACEAKE